MEQYWDGLFERMAEAVRLSGKQLPSVSTIAREKHDPFRVLIYTIISLRTKDAVTIAASRRLFELSDTPSSMANLGAEQIGQAIYPGASTGPKPPTSWR